MNPNNDLLDHAIELFRPPDRSFERLIRRRDRKQRNRRVSAAGLAIVITLLSITGLVRAFSNSELPATEPTPTPVDRGIFSQVGGWIAYADNRGTSGIWAVDPEAPGDPRDQILLSPGTGEPVAWSSDGTELLVISPEGGLIILHADETETLLRGPLLSDEWFDAAISPDGSLVAYAATTRDGLTSKLYAIDVDSDRTTLLAEPSSAMVYQPTFSPDGTQIAYMDGGGDHSHSVWVVDADGSDPHMIVENEVTSAGHVFGLAWSPTGDRIALGLRRLPAAGIYTFAPNGSGFTRLIRDAIAPSWSPDGSQIAYESYVMIPCPESPDTCWSEDRSGGLGVADADGSDLQRIEGVHPVGAIAWNPAG